MGALGVADDVAESAALGAQHAQAPARLGRQVDQVADRRLGRRRQPVLDVLVALAQDLQVRPMEALGSPSTSAESLTRIPRPKVPSLSWPSDSGPQL